MEEKYCSAKIFARKVGLSEKVVRNQIHLGVVPGFFCGTTFKINADEYLKVLRQKSLEGIEE